MDKKTAQKLLHRHWHETQAVPWINESASQKAFPFSAAFLQFVLSKGTDRQNISNLCYDLTALLGEVAAHLRHVDLHCQSEATIEAIVQRSIGLLDLEHKDISVADTLATALVEQLSDWGKDGANSILAGLFGEVLTLIAQTLNCVNNNDAWTKPRVSLLEACERAVAAPESNWQLAVFVAREDTVWGERLRTVAERALNPETRLQAWYDLRIAVETYRKQKCCHCYEPGSIRYSCGEYAGRYCDEHWETAGFRPADDRIDYLDAGEYSTEQEAY